MNFFIRRGTQEFGPYSEADLRTYVASGNIQSGEFARAEGSAQLTPVFSILAPPPPFVAGSAPPPPFIYGGGVPPPQYTQQCTQLQPMPQGYVQDHRYPQPKERIAYILLGIFLGVFGVHNFYAGYTGRAVAQLLISVLTLFFGSFISAIWAIIDVCTVTADASGVPFK
jgi:TM2 domain-containing membrane protein YozV